MNPAGHLQVGEPVRGTAFLDEQPKSICPRKPCLKPLCITCRGGGACASIPAVVLALINLTPITSVVRLAAALWLHVGVQDAAATVHALDVAGTTGGSCRRQRIRVMQKHRNVCFSALTYREETVWERAAPSRCRYPRYVHWDMCRPVRWG